MAPLTDVLIADADEADVIAADLDPLSTRDGVAPKGVDPVKLARLEAVVTGRSLESVTDGLRVLVARRAAGAGRPLLYRLAF